LVHNAARHEEQLDHADQNNDRNKMRRVGDILYDFHKTFVFEFVKQDGQDDGEREARDQAVEVQHYGIFDDREEHVAREEFQEVFEQRICPGTRGDARAQAEFLEGELNAVHRRVFEHAKINNRRGEEYVELPVPEDAAPEFLPGRHEYARRRIHNIAS